MNNTQLTRSEGFGVSSGFLGLYQRIAGGEKALVASILGKTEQEILGPSIIGSRSSLRFFDKIELLPGQKIQVYVPGNSSVQNIDIPGLHFIHPDAIVIQYQKIILNEGERAWLYDENGNYEEVVGPKVVYEHPEGKLQKFRRMQLSEREAIVKIQQDGSEEIIEGKKQAEVYINPVVETLKRFRWTGSGEKGAESDKVPGAINFEVLRLDNSQTYFSFSVRSKDNVVLELKLMIFYEISDLEKLIKNTHDPMCEFYNKIQAHIGSGIAEKNFDEVKKNTGELIKAFGTDTDLDFSEIGLHISQIVLREWTPAERRVQEILEKAAMVESQKGLDEAEHKRKIQLLEYEQTESVKRETLAQSKEKIAMQEGTQEAKKLVAIYEALKISLGPRGALALMKLRFASQAQELNIGSDMLR